MPGPVVATESNIYLITERGVKWTKLYALNTKRSEQLSHFLMGPLFPDPADGPTVVLGHVNGEIRLFPILAPGKMKIRQLHRVRLQSCMGDLIRSDYDLYCL